MEPGRPRLVSLDAFRGFTMALMILVNNPGTWSAIYWPLEHAVWHGWTPTDLVFPFFLFMVGMAIRFSSRDTWGAAVRRAAALFALGLFLNAYPFFDLATWRIPGVLQRIAVCYLAVWMIKRASGPVVHAAVAVSLLVLYWIVMTTVAVPGVGPANLEPETNLAAYVDSKLLAGHMYVLTRTWDPEGFLSTAPSVSTTLLGLLAGAWLTSSRPPQVKAAGFLAAGVILAVLGLAWGESFPINKNLWTSSFVLLTAGLASALFGLFYLLADVWGYRGWTRPFVVFGMNAIFLYAGAAILTRTLNVVKPGDVSLQARAYGALFASWVPEHAASLAWAVSMVLLWCLILEAMHRRGWHFRV